MDPKHLFYLSVILEKGSITDAAKHLNLAQTTLTRIMSTLEMQTGYELFSRSRFGVKPTPLGEELAREGRAIKRTLLSAEQTAANYKIGFGKEIRVGVATLLAATLMREIILKTLESLSGSRITWTIQNPIELYDLLLDGALDLIVAPSTNVRHMPGIQYQLIAEENLYIYCGIDHYLRDVEKITASQLEDAQWLSLSPTSPIERQAFDMLSSAGITKTNTQSVFKDDGHLFLDALALSQHLTILPELIMKLAPNPNRFYKVPYQFDRPQKRMIHLWLKDDFTEHPVAKFIQDELNKCRTV